METENQKSCPYCESNEFIQDFKSGDLICTSCGVCVESHMIDTSAEWNNHSESGEDKSRVGFANSLLVDLSTTFSLPLPKNNNNGMSSKSENFSRLQKVGESQNSKRQSLMEEIERLGSRSSLTENIIFRAKELVIVFETNKPTKTKFKKEVLCSCLLVLACRDLHFPRSLREISRLTDCDEKELKTTFTRVSSFIKVSHPSSTDGRELLPSICNKLNIPYSIQSKVLQLIEKTSNKHLFTGKSPISIVSVCLLEVCKNHSYLQISDKDICQASNISITTMRTLSKILKHSTINFEDLNT